MAIILEEAKHSKIGPIIIGWVVVLAIIIGGVYYLFFVPKPGIEVFLPAEQELTTQLSGIEINPNEILSDPTYQLLRQYPSAAPTGRVGRTNPFVKF